MYTLQKTLLNVHLPLYNIHPLHRFIKSTIQLYLKISQVKQTTSLHLHILNWNTVNTCSYLADHESAIWQNLSSVFHVQKIKENSWNCYIYISNGVKDNCILHLIDKCYSFFVKIKNSKWSPYKQTKTMFLKYIVFAKIFTKNVCHWQYADTLST